LANLQSSLSSLSTVSANLARNEKGDAKNAANNSAVKQVAESAAQQASSISTEKTVAQVNTPASDSASSADSAAANPVVGRPSGLMGIQVEEGHATEVNGQTTLHFQLVNTARNKSQSWTGRVCGVAELSNSTADSKGSTSVAMAARGSVSGYLALPGGFKVESARAPSNGCADGELVRFSRLRPTELVIPARQDSIKRVTIFFVEAGSNRTLSQHIEL
jgi:pyruvate/2-oxoglutarate dehydrogenase complex dihydrolipoamide acyltransferase (E2) component